MITITEALAEVNLIKKKIEDADSGARTMLVRAEHVPDFYEKHGGAGEMFKRTSQQSNDLRRRLVHIRSAISKANIENQITINDQTMSIFDWLSWKREVYPTLEKTLKQQLSDLKTSAEQEARNPQVWKDSEGKTHLVKFVRNVDLKELEDRYNNLIDTYGKLDGQLSLKNATITIN